MSNFTSLKELIQAYRSNSQSFVKACQTVSATPSSASRYRIQQQPLLIESTDEGSFLAIQEDETIYWLFPKIGFQVNEFNYPLLEILYKCYGYEESRYTDFKFHRPAKLEIDNASEQFRFVAPGILEFNNFLNNAVLTRTTLELESSIIDLEQSIRQTTINIHQRLTALEAQFNLFSSPLATDAPAIPTDLIERLQIIEQEATASRQQGQELTTQLNDRVQTMQTQQKALQTLRTQLDRLQTQVSSQPVSVNPSGEIAALSTQIQHLESQIHNLRYDRINTPLSRDPHLQDKLQKRYIIFSGVLALILYCLNELTQLDAFKLFLVIVMVAVLYLVVRDTIQMIRDRF